MQEECAVAGHPTSVVHNSGDVAEKREMFRETNQMFAEVAAKMTYWEMYAHPFEKMDEEKKKKQAYSPLASSSQISKKTMRSYLAWQGPAVERFIVLSFVAGTERLDIRV